MYNSPYQAPAYGTPMPSMQPQMQMQTQVKGYSQYAQPVNNMPVQMQVNRGVIPMMPQAYQPPVQQVMDEGGIGLNFGSLVDGTESETLPVALPVVTDLPEKKSRKKKDEKKEHVNHAEEVDAVVYSDTYTDTNVLLHQTIGQLDMVAAEMKDELDKIVKSRTLKGRYMAMGNVSKSLSDMLSTKVQAIKELNNSIKAVNDMEYRRAKDNRSFESNQGDDKAIMDLYNAFVQAPVSANIPATGPYSLIGPDLNDVMFGANNMRAGTNEVIATDGSIITYDPNQSQQNAMFNNYMSNLTPEQNAMINEGKTETVVIYDKATGAKSFEVVDSKTMQPVPNMPIPDPMFLADVTVDARRKIARNTNLNQVYKVITINDDKVSEY